jgi:hypothetical protein
MRMENRVAIREFGRGEPLPTDRCDGQLGLVIPLPDRPHSNQGKAMAPQVSTAWTRPPWIRYVTGVRHEAAPSR